MQYSFGAGKIKDFFPYDEVFLGEKDRRATVSDKELLTFPFNAIGWIRSKQKKSKSSGPSPEAKGTGFLISQSLVLTSSNNFVIRDQDNGEVIQYVPISFSTLQPGESGLVQKISRVKMVKLNMQFVGLLNRIAMLKNMHLNQEDQTLKQKYLNKIFALEEETIIHDFALLKLEQPIERPQYFQLCLSLNQKCELAVTEYVHHSGTSFTLFTHSNIFNSIRNGGIYYDIDAKSEQSGCPVYILKNIIQLVGIHKAYDHQKHLNFATMITESVMTVLKQWAQQMDVSFIKLNQNSIEQVNRLMEKGDQFKDVGQMEDALKCYKTAFNISLRLNGKNLIEFAKTLSSIGWVHRYNQRFEQSLECYISELMNYEIIMKHQSLQKANALTNISIVYYKLDKLKQASEFYEMAMKIYEKIGTQSIQCPHALQSIGIMHYFQNKLKQALEYYDRAVSIYQKIGKESINLANIFSNMGLVYKNQGKLKQALEYYDKSVNIYQKIGKESTGWAVTLKSIGIIYKNQGKHNQAIEYYGKALTIYQKIGKQSIGWAVTLKSIGLVYKNQGKYKQSLEYYDKATNIFQKIGKESIGWANTLKNIASVYDAQGLHQKANQFLAKSKTMKERLK